MSRSAWRSTLVAIIALMSTAAVADAWSGDAGSGGDAPNTRVNALSVNTGTTYTGLVIGSDVDWYAASVVGSGPGCIRAPFTSNVRAYMALGLESGALTTTAPTLVGGGGSGVAGIATNAADTATLRVRRDPIATANSGTYTFGFEHVGIPTGYDDAGLPGDAGATISTARAASAGCITGRLAAGSPLDTHDIYSISVGAGDVVTYSLAASGSGLEVRLLDSLGQVVGPAVLPGGVGLAELGAGTYFVSAARTTGTTDIGYVVGIIVGPEPSSCRPYCLE